MKIMKLVFVAPSYAAIMLACCAVGHGCAAAGEDETSAPRSLEAAYSITFARVLVGAASLHAEFRDNEYVATFTGHAGGVIRVMLDGSAFLSTQGVVRDGHLIPTSFTSNLGSETETQGVRMALDDGTVKELEATPPIGVSAVPEKERHGIIDPLSTLLVPSPEGDSNAWPEVCRRTLPVFDGRNRYDLRLAFKRMDNLSDDHGYKGPVVVCALTFVPIAGPSGTTPLVKFLTEGREIEVALAPVSGTPVLAPVRLFVASWVANLVIATSQFEATHHSLPGTTVGPQHLR